MFLYLPPLREIIPYRFGWWRSPVAHLHGVQGVAGSNPVHPTSLLKKQSCKRLLFLSGDDMPCWLAIAANIEFTSLVRTVLFFLLYIMPLGKMRYCNFCFSTNFDESQREQRFAAIFKPFSTAISRFELKSCLCSNSSVVFERDSLYFSKYFWYCSLVISFSTKRSSKSSN